MSADQDAESALPAAAAFAGDLLLLLLHALELLLAGLQGELLQVPGLLLLLARTLAVLPSGCFGVFSTGRVAVLPGSLHAGVMLPLLLSCAMLLLPLRQPDGVL